MSKPVSYIQEVTKEMKKVNWPSRKELIDNTGLTLLVTLILAVVVFAQDQVISNALQFIYELI
ncbi:MAG: preprotein translocase subunit SecE [Bacteroidota bacterium]